MAFRSDPTEPDVHMPLGDHLDELRRRLFFALLGMIPIAIVAFYFGTDLLEFVVEPVREALRGGWQPAVLQATSPFETFGTYIKVSTIATLLVGSPWVLYQLWAFVAPGLYAHERRYVYFLLPLSSVLTITGVIFLFRVILPLILSFAVAFGSGLGAKVAMPQPPPESRRTTRPSPRSSWFPSGVVTCTKTRVPSGLPSSTSRKSPVCDTLIA